MIRMQEGGYYRQEEIEKEEVIIDNRECEYDQIYYIWYFETPQTVKIDGRVGNRD